MRLTLAAFLAVLPVLAQSSAGKSDQPAAQQAPSSMLKMVVRLIGPNTKPGSFAALPRTIYAADPHFARIEDPPDARQGVQKLIIIAEPDAYSINVMDHKGTHALDHGGDNDLHLPIILPFDPRHELKSVDKLEFGDELAFFQNAHAMKAAGPIINARPTTEYTLKAGAGDARLIVWSDSEIPVSISWPEGSGRRWYEYISYETLPYDAGLFRKPPGVHLREIPSDMSTGDRE